jgi:hypothetical protein
MESAADHQEEDDVVDYLDQLSTKLDWSRSVVWAVGDQIDRLKIPSQIAGHISGEIGLVYAQLAEAQELIERLSARAPHLRWPRDEQPAAH